MPAALGNALLIALMSAPFLWALSRLCWNC